MNIIETDLQGQRIERIEPWQQVALEDGPRLPEKWLQGLLFDHPEAIPFAQMDPVTAGSVAVCRELKLGTGPLDLLFVSPQGRLTLVECKLWRNHEARRKVIGQILDYAAQLATLRLSDLQAEISRRLSTQTENPLYDLVRGRANTASEKDFTERLEHDLRAGQLSLIIAGDGIRSEAQVIGEFLKNFGHPRFSLGFLQIDVYRRGDRLLVQPQVPVKVQAAVRRVFVGSTEAAEDSEPDSADAEPVKPDDGLRAVDREFFESFIKGLKLQHSEQPPPRHGGRNWVRFGLPLPGAWLTVYRARSSKHTLGAFVGLRGLEGAAAYEQLRAAKTEIEGEVGDALQWKEADAQGRATISLSRDWPNIDDRATHAAQKSWLAEAANRMINAFRPRLRALSDPAAS